MELNILTQKEWVVSLTIVGMLLGGIIGRITGRRAKRKYLKKMQDKISCIKDFNKLIQSGIVEKT